VSITLTLPLTGTATAGTTINPLIIHGNNGGTLVVDAQSPNPQCWQKTNYRGEPHEWGALGDNSTDDTTALENWLGAYGNVSNLALTATPNTFGPWIATIPAIYMVSAPLYCPPNAHLQATANDSHPSGNPEAPIIQIKAAPSTAGTPFSLGGAPNGAVMTAQIYCRISGLSINANNVATSSMLVDALDIAGTNANAGFGVIVDDHTELTNGYYNLSCIGGTSFAGLQVKDSEFGASGSDNIHIPTCPNVRLIGDVVTQAGLNCPMMSGITCSGLSQADVYFGGEDLTLSNGVLEDSNGIDLDLVTANSVSVTGMFFDTSGAADNLSAGVEIDTSKNISICGSHFNQNDQTQIAGFGTGSHIRFGGTASTNITLCGNNYKQGDNTPETDYVYDAQSGVTITNTSFYEAPQMQVTGVYTPAAQSLILPFLQVSAALNNNNFTGLTLSNDPTFPNTVIDIAAGQAADSTNASIIIMPSIGCKVTMGSTGPGGLDTTSGVMANKTYFFFIIAPAGGGAPTSCIASLNTTPSFSLATGYSLYRLVGALYTIPSAATLVQFVQNGDTFYLDKPVPDVNNMSIGTSSPTSLSLVSVPSGIVVEALGRCVASSSVSGSEVLIFPYSTAPGSPAGYPTAPGFTIKTGSLTTAFPYRLHTTNGTLISAFASGTSAVTLNCMTDGWVLHRGP
jgi:hypothetical protein